MPLKVEYCHQSDYTSKCYLVPKILEKSQRLESYRTLKLKNLNFSRFASFCFLSQILSVFIFFSCKFCVLVAIVLRGKFSDASIESICTCSSSNVCQQWIHGEVILNQSCVQTRTRKRCRFEWYVQSVRSKLKCFKPSTPEYFKCFCENYNGADEKVKAEANDYTTSGVRYCLLKYFM